MITESEFKKHLDSYRTIDVEIERITEEYSDKFLGRADIMSIELWEESIYIEYENHHCSCCGPEYGSATIPVNYIWDENWQEQEVEKRRLEQLAKDEEKRLEKLAREKARRQAAKQAEKDRYAEFLRMKEEYGE